MQKCTKIKQFCARMPVYSSSSAHAMLSLQSSFQVIPHETAVVRFVAEGHRAEISDFYCGIVLGMVQGVEVPAIPGDGGRFSEHQYWWPTQFHPIPSS